MAHTFTEKVIFKLKSKAQKVQIEAELTDHLQLRESYFADLGYEQEPAADKADRALGDGEDAEIVGEQLALIGAKQRRKRIACFIALALFFALYYCLRNNIYWVAPDAAPRSGWCSFVLDFSALALCLLLSFFTFRKNVAFPFVACIQSVLLNNQTLQSVLLYLLHGRSLAAAICLNELSAYAYATADTTKGHLSPSPLEKVTIAWIAAVVLPAALTAILHGRKKRLKTTKRELRLSKVLRAMLLFSAVAVVSFTAVVGGICAKEYENYAQITLDTLTRADSMVLENLDVFTGNDLEAAVGAVQKTFPELKANYVKRDDDELAVRYLGAFEGEPGKLNVFEDELNFYVDGVSFYYTSQQGEPYDGTSLYDFSKFSLNARYTDLFGNYLPFAKDGKAREKAFLKNGAKPEELPLPCELYEDIGKVGVYYGTCNPDVQVANLFFTYRGGQLVLDTVVDYKY